MSENGGQNLGTARGSIILDTSSLQAGVQASRTAGQQIQANLSKVSIGATGAQRGVQGLSAAMGQLGAAIGIVGGVAGALKLGQFALDADAVATAYRRQTVAALGLAGSQDKLNQLLKAYDTATGGVIDKASALADVTKLQAVGFADDAAELTKFTVAARGISVAMGGQQDYVISQLQLAIANQSTLRLDQLGLGVAEVEARIKQLKAADSSLTKEMAYQNAILGLATEKFGKLATSAEAQATGAEQAAKAWKDFKLELGTSLGPGISEAMVNVTKGLKDTSDWFKQIAERYNELRLSFGNTAEVSGLNDVIAGGLANLKVWTDGLTEAGNAIRELMGLQLTNAAAQAGPQFNTPAPKWMTSAWSPPAAKAAAIDPNLEKQQADMVAHYQAVQAIERNANAARLAATQQYESQRSETIRSYEVGLAREAQDFGISRARAATQLAETIAGIQEDSAKQAADWAEDLADSIAKMQRDSGRRLADAQEDYAERQAEAVETSNKRVAEINEAYAISREKAERSHHDNLMDAAANLDARAVYEEQRSYAESSKDAKDAHDKALEDESENLADRTKKESESLAERVKNEQESLAERIADAQEANAKQLADAKESAAERITDAQEALAKQQAMEDSDRALRLQRGAEDQAAQLAAMAAAQAAQMAQIEANAAEELAAEEEDFLAALAEDGLRNNKWLLQQTELKRLALLEFDLWWKHITEKFMNAQVGPTSANQPPRFVDPNLLKGWASGGAITENQVARLHKGEFVMNRAQVAGLGGYAGAGRMAAGGRSSTLNLAAGSVIVNASPGMDAEAVGMVVERRLIGMLEGLA